MMRTVALNLLRHRACASSAFSTVAPLCSLQCLRVLETSQVVHPVLRQQSAEARVRGTSMGAGFAVQGIRHISSSADLEARSS